MDNIYKAAKFLTIVILNSPNELRNLSVSYEILTNAWIVS